MEKEHLHATSENRNLETCMECPLKIAKVATTKVFVHLLLHISQGPSYRTILLVYHQMDERVVCMRHGVLVGHEEEGNSAMWNKIDRMGDYRIRQNKPDSETLNNKYCIILHAFSHVQNIDDICFCVCAHTYIHIHS